MIRPFLWKSSVDASCVLLLQSSTSCLATCVLSLCTQGWACLLVCADLQSVLSSFPTVLRLKYCSASDGFIFILQTLAECKQRPAFSRLLKLYEEKAVCCGRTIENYLTAPMHRVSNQEIVHHYNNNINAATGTWTVSAKRPSFGTLVMMMMMMSYLYCLTNRFHVAVRLFSIRSQMTSKCGKNKKLAIAECHMESIC